MYKEAHPLFWPWCAVVAAALLPLAHPPQLMELIWPIGFFLGIPLLATLPLGNEFEHRTLSLLLSQPIRRTKIWGEKLSVTVVAVLSAVLFFSLTLRATSFQQDWKVWAFGGAWIVAITAAATFWTLFTRSTVGGVVLNIGIQSFIGFAVPWANLVTWLRARGYLAPGNPIVVSSVVFVFVCYAGAMLWLGWRKLARFQATGGMAGDDLLTAGPDVLPGAWVGWLRCRPTGAVLNLIRKEFRLLRPVWLISLLAAVGWACLTLVGSLHPQGLTRTFETTVVSAGVITMLIIAVLAGSLSLGEEKTSGTHAWQLTLPVSARRQWFIKLSMALFAGFTGAGLVPLLIAGRLVRSSHMLADVHVGRELLVGAVLLTFASFWCACAVKGMVPAVLCPVVITLYFAGELGKWAGPALTNLYFSRFDPFGNVKFAKAVSSIFETFAISRPALWEFFYNRGYFVPMVWAVLVPTLFLAVIQSYRLFQAQLQDSARSLVRNLLPLAGVTCLCSFSLMAFFSFAGRALNQRSIALFEATDAIQKIQSGAPKLDAAHPLELTVEDLAKVSPLSKSTRRLLGDSHITLVLDEPPHHGQFGCGANLQSHGLSALGYSWYSAVIPLRDGSHFVVTFEPVTHSVISAGFCGGQPPPSPVRVPW
jgi:ABC-type transport system involved in multi-copper enzyme maturation permease subunit